MAHTMLSACNGINRLPGYPTCFDVDADKPHGRYSPSNRKAQAETTAELQGLSGRSFFAGEGWQAASLRTAAAGTAWTQASGVCFITCMAGDYYKTLGVGKAATKQEIKTAYRRLARQYHPDVNKEADAEDKFKAISNAYEVLSDDQKKAVYDRYGEDGLKGSAGMGGASQAYTTNPFDLFETIFGSSMGGMGGRGAGFGTRRRGGPIAGEDIAVELSVDIMEVVFGAEKVLELQHLETCGSCNGSGAKAGTTRKQCATCGGMGQVMSTRQTAFGTFSQVTTCNTCQGEGEIVTDYCRKCGGEGRVRAKKKVSINVPVGVQAGMVLRAQGEGDAGMKGGPPGDLYVTMAVRDTADMQRDGNNLQSRLAVDYTDAILGTVAKVKTVEGLQELRVPPGTQPGDMLVLSRLGVPELNRPNVRGDHIFTVRVSIPTKLSVEERKLVEELATLQKSGKSRGGLRNPFARPQERRAEPSSSNGSSRQGAGTGAAAAAAGGERAEEAREGDKASGPSVVDAAKGLAERGGPAESVSQMSPPQGGSLRPVGTWQAAALLGTAVLVGLVLWPLLSNLTIRILTWIRGLRKP